MSTATVLASSETLLTAEEFAALPDDRKTELVAGKVIVVPPPAFVHGKVQVEIAFLLRLYLRKHDVGHVLTESGVVTTRGPDTVRGPDVSFYSYERVPRDQPPEVYAAAAPEVVFEVRSPGNRPGALLRKAGEYLGAGSLAVCIVDPARRTAVLYVEDETVLILTEQQTLHLPEPLAQWTPRIGDFFPSSM